MESIDGITQVTKGQARRPRPFITRLEQRRREAGYSVSELSREAGVTHAYTSRIEAQTIPASKRYQQAVAKALGTQPHFLFGDDGRAL